MGIEHKQSPRQMQGHSLRCTEAHHLGSPSSGACCLPSCRPLKGAAHQTRSMRQDTLSRPAAPVHAATPPALSPAEPVRCCPSAHEQLSLLHLASWRPRTAAVHAVQAGSSAHLPGRHPRPARVQPGGHGLAGSYLPAHTGRNGRHLHTALQPPGHHGRPGVLPPGLAARAAGTGPETPVWNQPQCHSRSTGPHQAHTSVQDNAQGQPSGPSCC